MEEGLRVAEGWRLVLLLRADVVRLAEVVEADHAAAGMRRLRGGKEEGEEKGAAAGWTGAGSPACTAGAAATLRSARDAA